MEGGDYTHARYIHNGQDMPRQQTDVYLERLNDVMLFLKVSHLSDIVNSDGSDIEHWALYEPPTETSVT